MRTSLAFAVSLVLAGTANAACERDFTGVTRDGEPTPLSVACPACRNAAQFPQDVRNAGFNYFVYGAGRNIWHMEINTDWIMGTYKDIHVAIRTPHGQVVTIRFRTNFRTLPGPFGSRRNVGVESFSATSILPNGDGSATANLPPTQAPLSVPHNNIVDRRAGQCLNNQGFRVRNTRMFPAGDTGQQQWERLPRLWPRNQLHRYCGHSVLDNGGKGRTTCQHADRT